MSTSKVKTKARTELNRENLKAICWLNGMTITGLAKAIGRSRQTIYDAVAAPEKYPVAYAAIEHTLAKRP